MKSAFVSTVLVYDDVRNLNATYLGEVERSIAILAEDYEILVVVNAPHGKGRQALPRQSDLDEVGNLTLYALAERVETDVALAFALERGLGDFFIFLDPSCDVPDALEPLLAPVRQGFEIVLVDASRRPKTAMYSILGKSFGWILKVTSRGQSYRRQVDLKVLSRNASNFVSRSTRPEVMLRYLRYASPFRTEVISTAFQFETCRRLTARHAISRSLHLLFSTTTVPLRAATSLSLVGAVASIVYSIYALLSGLTNPNVAPGWVSMSLQQAGMFFLIAMVLMLLSEYMLNSSTNSRLGRGCYVVDEVSTSGTALENRFNVRGAVADLDEF